GIPHTREIFDCFIHPLLEQIRTDAPEQIVVLAENRLGLRGPITSVRQAARDLGLEPFPIPLAINYGGDNGRAPCEKVMTCDLFPCKIGAKNDLAVTLLPAAQRYGALIKDRTIATKLVLRGRKVGEVECLDLASDRRFKARGTLVIVSCGAIPSAALLIRSGLQHVGRGGRLIGRRLMRHCSGIVVGMFPFKTNPERQFHKQVALTDFYYGRSDAKPIGPWGMIQALQTPPPEYIRAASPYGPLLGWIGAQTVKYQSFLLCLAEDLPNPRNRVELDPKRTDPHGMPLARVFHQYSRRDLAARRALYRVAGRILRKAGSLFRIRMPIHTYSHAVGTCRFGTDPQHAVLDPWCRMFGTDNLYVVDGSFFPSSGGVNPSLTIAANGFRVGHHLVEQWD
ncbi:MAG: GMC oxidoreductase, partial [Gemmatimonadales bacterium]